MNGSAACAMSIQLLGSTRNHCFGTRPHSQKQLGCSAVAAAAARKGAERAAAAGGSTAGQAHQRCAT
eukprot:7615275-Lingulodinium_polyedra.AAC.1